MVSHLGFVCICLVANVVQRIVLSGLAIDNCKPSELDEGLPEVLGHASVVC